MDNIDVATLLRESLLISGCNPELLGEFDSHSTIMLDFHSMPSMLVSTTDEGVWLWSRIAEENTNVLVQRSTELLSAIMDGCLFTHTGQLQLECHDGFIELKGLVHQRYLQSSEQFSEALNEFFEMLEKFGGIIQ